MRCRLKLNCVGILDVLAPVGEDDIIQQQQDDIRAMARLLLCLATLNIDATQDISSSLQYVGVFVILI